MPTLPSIESGYLPYGLLFFVTFGTAHSIVAYLRPKTGLTQFSGPKAPPPHPLLAHVYGVKNFYTALIRVYAAYHIDSPELYDLATLTWLGVFLLFATELLVWRTVRVKEGVFPLATSLGMLGWMVLQRGWYVR